MRSKSTPCLVHKLIGVARALAIIGVILFAGNLWQASAASNESYARGERRDRYAKFDGMRVHYEDFGKGNEALVFVHGWTCSADFWQMQVPAFSNRMRVIAIDLPGHGASDKPKIAYTQDLFARSIESVLRDAGVKRATLVGHSMGTPVVRQFYRLYPKRTRALVFVDGSLRLIAPRAAMENFFAPLKGVQYETAMSRMVDALLGARMPSELRAEARAAMLATPQHVVVSAGESMLNEAIYKPDRINVPVLAIFARSPAWPRDNEAFYRSLAPNLDYRMWDGVGHFLMMEKPQEFNEALMEFLVRNKLVKNK
ncbi:MAG: alpha/beta hydrolase [Pyrinomonadaceae bacterium]|nr:alpha/beta hydrolase [Pyrinomonadaceae bacterium]